MEVSAEPQRGHIAATGSEQGAPAAMWREPLHAAVLEHAGTGALLDLGCGTGEFARYATERDGDERFGDFLVRVGVVAAKERSA